VAGGGTHTQRPRDWVVGIVLDTTDQPAQIVAFRRWRNLPWPETQRRIEGMAALYPGKILIDASGSGEPMTQYLAIDLKPVVFSGKAKFDMVRALQMALERGDIRGPAKGDGIEALWDELLLYRWEDKALTQDCVMTLAMAAKELVDGPSGMWFQR
jgi:hypothetical protein